MKNNKNKKKNLPLQNDYVESGRLLLIADIKMHLVAIIHSVNISD